MKEFVTRNVGKSVTIKSKLSEVSAQSLQGSQNADTPQYVGAVSCFATMPHNCLKIQNNRSDGEKKCNSS